MVRHPGCRSIAARSKAFPILYAGTIPEIHPTLCGAIALGGLDATRRPKCRVRRKALKDGHRFGVLSLRPSVVRVRFGLFELRDAAHLLERIKDHSLAVLLDETGT